MFLEISQNSQENTDFAKLCASRTFSPYVPLLLRTLRALRAFVPYAPSRLTRLRVLRTFVHFEPSRLAYLTALRTLFGRVKIVLGLIFSPGKTFLWIIKGTTNCVLLNKSLNLK